jgi:NitT/TauT family transport system permease protein
LTNRLIIVPFSEVMQALYGELIRGDLWLHTRVTIVEIAASFPVAVVLGIVLGLLIASSRILQQILDPLLTAMYSVPIVALAPLFIAWLGFGIESKIAVILLVSVFPIIINTEVGLRSTDRHLIEAARSFNASPLQIFRTVTFPFAIPFIIGGVRVAFARALVGVVVAEFFGAFAGYGYAILAASQTYNTARLLAYVLVLAFLGMLSSIALQAWEKRLAPWRETRE